MGSTPPTKERKGVKRPKGNLRSQFDQIPVSIIFDVIVRPTFFVLWAMQHRWVVKACAGGNNEALAAVLLYSTVQYSTAVQLCTVHEHKCSTVYGYFFLCNRRVVDY